MRAGQFDRRITLQLPEELDKDDGYGIQKTGAWYDVYSRLPAEVKDDLPSKSETVQNGLRLSAHPARVRMPFMRGVTANMRVVVHNDQDDIYQIDSDPAEIGRREMIEFTIRGYST